MAALSSEEYEKLTHRHGVRIQCRVGVEECCLAAGDVVGLMNLVAADHYYEDVSIFVKTVEQADELIRSGIVIRGQLTPVLPFIDPSRNVPASSDPPVVEVITHERSQSGKPVSQVREKNLGCNAPGREEQGSTDSGQTAESSIDEYSKKLVQQYESLVKQDKADQAEHAQRLESLKKMRDEKKRHHQSLIEKIESLQVKLDLNSSKTTRKNFTVKLEELTAEKDRLTEGKRRVAQEFEEAERKLKQLLEEQNNEKLTWEEEIADLQVEKERLAKEAEEAKQIALKDEIAAVESQRELGISQVEDWIAEAERYVSNLRLDPSPQHARQRLEWEKNVVMVRNSLGRLQSMYNENIRLLRSGQQLESLPAVSKPSLPSVPTIDLFMSPLRNSQMQYHNPMIRVPPLGPMPDFHPSGVPIHRAPPPHPAVSSQNHSAAPAHASSHTAMPKPQLTMPTSFPPQAPLRMSTMSTVPLHHPQPHPYSTNSVPHTVTPASTYAATGPAHVSMATTNVTAPTATSQPTGLPAQAAAGRSHVTLPVGAARNSSPQTVPSNPPPAGKLDKLLERLGTQFPQCTRTQLMGVLQQIKSERGTMAGMSMEEVAQQVFKKLEQSDCLALGPIAPLSTSRAFAALPGPIQRPSVQPFAMRPPLQTPSAPVYQPRPPQPPPVRKLCLMCQNHVQPGTQYNTNCSHTLHKECLSVWLQSSKNNSCPFCPSK